MFDRETVHEVDLDQLRRLMDRDWSYRIYESRPTWRKKLRRWRDRLFGMILTPRGFGLLDLMLACAVLALVLAAIIPLLYTGTKTWQYGATRIDETQEARGVLAQMEKQLRVVTDDGEANAVIARWDCTCTLAVDKQQVSKLTPPTYTLSATTASGMILTTAVTPRAWKPVIDPGPISTDNVGCWPGYPGDGGAVPAGWAGPHC
jgi:hypothetical protein